MALPHPVRSLSAKLLVLVILFIVIGEVLIYTPSIARFRMTWIDQQLGEAHLAGLSMEAAEDQMLTEQFKYQLLDSVALQSITVARPTGDSYTIARSDVPPIDARFDRSADTWLNLIVDAFATMLRPEDRTVAFTGPSPRDRTVTVTAVTDEAPLKAAMYEYSGRILLLTAVLSAITAAMLFIAVRFLMVRPVQRLTRAMVAFRQNPEAVPPVDSGGRGDEIGVAEREFSLMQTDVRRALNQKERLAALGEAVNKINHDLRGMITSASLLSERLVSSQDPEVRRLAPRLLDSLDRAARLCSQTLTYAREGSQPPNMADTGLAAVVAEAWDLTADLRAHDSTRPAPTLANDVAESLMVRGDRDQLVRAVGNILRNAVQAGASRIAVTAHPAGDVARLAVRDDGPGLPPRARDNLFRPFAASTHKDGSGLGLAIAREIAHAHGGRLELVESTGSGTVFRLTLPMAAGSAPAQAVAS